VSLSLAVRGFFLSSTLTAASLAAASAVASVAIGSWAAGFTGPQASFGFLVTLGLTVAVLAGVTTSLVIRRLTAPLAQLAARMGEVAASGNVDAGGARSGHAEIQPVEEAFRALLLALEEARQARDKSYVEAVGAVVTAADARDHETSGHSFRVALYSLALARRLGLPADQLKAIEWGSLLHDVGKMVVPDEILRKTTSLTPSEWHIMKQHPNWGHDILSGVGFLHEEALDIVHSHHERWDGQGYPRGLAGEAIPLGARIFAVVDTYDAITSDRPYRRARGHPFAIAELEQAAGFQLDPQVVALFAAIPEVELRRLRDLCRRAHPGLSIPGDLLDYFEEGTEWKQVAETG